MKPCILALDIGTSSVKASLVSDELRVIAQAHEDYKTFYPALYYAVQHAEDWWEAACRAVRSLINEKEELFQSISAIGVSGHMLGLLPVDSKGNALCPSMIHADTRASKQAEHIEHILGTQWLYNTTGNVLTPAAPLCKALWLSDEHPDILAKSTRFLQSKDYLNFRLTGNLDVTDYSDASHAMLIDIGSGKYLSAAFKELRLRETLFPTLHRSTDIIGRLSKEASQAMGLPCGIPVVAGGGDGACANVGAGIVHCGKTYCSLGTTGWIASSMNKPYLDPLRRVFNIMSLDAKHYGVYGTVQSVGRCIQWIQSLLQIDDVNELNRVAKKSAALCDGLIFLPYLEGERSPIYDPLASGVFFGIRSTHSREHFARSVFEGVSFALSGIVNIMRESLPINTIRIIGGGSKSELWRRILSDASGASIRQVTTSADMATSLGAAAAAGVAVGMFKDIESAAEYISDTDEMLPDSDYEAYQRAMRLYESLYQLLKPAFHNSL